MLETEEQAWEVIFEKKFDTIYKWLIENDYEYISFNRDDRFTISCKTENDICLITADFGKLAIVFNDEHYIPISRSDSNIIERINNYISDMIYDIECEKSKDLKPITFDMSSVETMRANKFAKKHKNCRPLSTEGASGIEYSFMPTGIGTCCKVTCLTCGKSEDITDNNW